MPGRNAKPISLHVAEGNPNRLTKAEIEARQEAEVKLGKDDLSRVQVPDFVKNNIVAFKQWQKLIKEYRDAAKKGVEILSTSDLEILAKYCITHSEYLSLIERRNRIDEIDYVSMRADAQRIRGAKRKAMNEILRLDDFLKLETAINKKHDQLIKLEDRLFLNPLSKVKNVPKQEKAKPGNPMEAKFGI